MKKRFFYLAPLVIILAGLLILGACSSTTTPTTTIQMTLPPTTTPTVTVTTPTLPPTTTATVNPTTTVPPPNTTTGAPTAVTISLSAQNLAFDKNTITVPAGAVVTINFTNHDTAKHNFALYINSSASTSIYIGNTISVGNITYTFTAPTTPGSYFFRCDVHPVMMVGEFIVQ